MLGTPLDPKSDIGRLKKGCAKDDWEMGVVGGNLGTFSPSVIFFPINSPMLPKSLGHRAMTLNFQPTTGPI